MYDIPFPNPRYPLLAPDGTVGAPSYSFGSATNSGLYYSSAPILAVGGSARYTFGSTSLSLGASAHAIVFGSDAIIIRDASNVLALRNSTSAQTFRVYNTYSDSSNYERGSIGWAANLFDISTGQAGTGSARRMALGTVGSAAITFYTNNTNRWDVNATGHFVPFANATYDCGTVALAIRNIFCGGYFTIGDGVTAPTATVGLAKLYVDTADGDLKVIFGDGTIKTIATDT